MDDFPDVQIKVTIGSKTLTLDFPQDCDIFEWGDQFKCILTWATFGTKTIDQLFPEE
jgi:hypothetical protein